MDVFKKYMIISVQKSDTVLEKNKCNPLLKWINFLIKFMENHELSMSKTIEKIQVNFEGPSILWNYNEPLLNINYL